MGRKPRAKKAPPGGVAEEHGGYGPAARRRQRSIQPKIHLLDVVALNAGLPGQGLLRGQVGTVVEELARGVFEVEFSDDQGKTYATAAVRAEQLIVLHYHPAKAS